MERNKAVPASYLVLINKNKILLTRRIKTGYYDGYYALPSGHIEKSEYPTECLEREIAEEIGIELDLKKTRLAHVLYRSKDNTNDDRADYFFVTETYTGEIKNMEPEKCDDIKWFPIDSLPENTIPYIKNAIVNIQNNVTFSEEENEQM